MRYKILDISLDLVEGYSPEITNSINYLSCFRSEQVLVEENIYVYRYKKRVKLAPFLIIEIRGLDYNRSFLDYDSLD